VPWMTEAERLMTVLVQHDWWARRPRLLREEVRATAEALAQREGKPVYQQHVLRAAADVAEQTNNAHYRRRTRSQNTQPR
jgi:hypothetical protein